MGRRRVATWAAALLWAAAWGLSGTAAPAPAAGAEAGAVVGYRGDGTGVFPGANPPLDWDESTGRNIVWRVPLPNWGHSSPVAVGDRVLVTCEPGYGSDWPVLVCLAAADGRVLWQREVNHLPAAPVSDEDRAEIARVWHEILAEYRLAYTLFNEYTYGGDREAALEKFKAHGFAYGGWKGGGYGQLRSLRRTDRQAWKERSSTIAKAGLDLETWYQECGMGTACVGQTFATPVSDGRCVYLATSLHSYACYDLDGNVKWMRFIPGEFSASGNDYCKNARSPLLYGDLFISGLANVVCALDRKTGETRWSHEIFGTHPIASPVVIEAGGADVLWCCGHAFRLPDGEKLSVEGWSNGGTCALVKSDERDVVFFTGGGEHGGWEGKGKCPTPPPAAVRFAVDGDTLRAKVLWSGVDGMPLTEYTGLVYHDRRLYHARGIVLDAATGQVVKGSTDRRSRDRAVPATRHLLAVAGGHVYGMHEGRGREGEPAQTGVCEVYTLAGAKAAESVLSNAPVEGPKREQVVQVNGWNTWRYSYACPFAVAGDRLYVRSNDYLWCLGRK